MSELQRLDKFIASQGTLSRSEVRKMINSGKITVNGEVVKKADGKIRFDDTVCINGQEILYKPYIYLLMDKPSGVVCAVSDKKEKTVIDLIPEKYRRKDLFPVGRLDKDTEGLLIITNDGDFAHKVTSPKTNLYKTYHITYRPNIQHFVMSRYFLLKYCLFHLSYTQEFQIHISYHV